VQIATSRVEREGREVELLDDIVPFAASRPSREVAVYRGAAVSRAKPRRVWRQSRGNIRCNGPV